MTVDLPTAVLRFSHGSASFTRAEFRLFRRALAAIVGIDLDDMEGFGGRVPWEMVADPLVPLLRASDVAGRVAAPRCALVAARLRAVLAEAGPRRAELGAQADALLAGLEAAATEGVALSIQG